MKKPEYVTYCEGYADITLATPATILGSKVSTLRMREPIVEDQLAADATSGSDAQKEIATFANLCDLAPDDIRKLTMRNYKRVQAAWLGFLD